MKTEVPNLTFSEAGENMLRDIVEHLEMHLTLP